MLRALLSCSLALVLLCRWASAEELINWHEDLASARQISQQYKVPLLIHFYGDQCMPCKTLEQNVFTKPEVASTMQRYFVPVRINATRDRKTAAEYGVHSWPQDVFVAPDGKTLVQGVCNQNPNNYLQNLQNVALMNRDRNAMLAGQQTAPTTTPAPYGRTAATTLQQAAPGRDSQAPAPYSNPSSGAAPYGTPGTLVSTPTGGYSQPPLPGPTWQGQSANGQAQSGLVNAGPIPNPTSATLPPPQAATVNENKMPNVPASSYWQAGNGGFSQAQLPQTSSGNLPLAPNASAQQTSPTVPLPSASPTFQSTPSGSQRDTVVANPHFAPQESQGSLPATHLMGQPNASQAAPVTNNNRGIPGQLVTSTNSVTRDNLADSPTLGLPSDPQSLSHSPLSESKGSNGTASVPALSGYCPVALGSEPSQWIKGSEKFAIRHRGRVYFLSDEAAIEKFLASPDNYTPVLSGHDPLIYLREGRLVEGSIYDGVLKDRQYLLLFSSQENKQYFYDNYDRLISELEAVVRQQVK